jgi:hypothetical protein
MRKILAIVVCLAIPLSLLAGDNSYKVKYDGGTLPDTKSGTDVRLFIDGDKVRFAKDNKDLAVVPASSITEISYG